MLMRRLVSVFAFLILLAPARAFAQNGTPPPGQPPPPAAAQNEMPDSFLAFFIGGARLNDKFFAGFPHGENPKAWGLQLDWWQRGILGAELDFGYSKNFLGTLSGANLLTLTANAIIGPWARFGDHSALRPYFVIGGGLQRTSAGGFTSFGATSSNRGVLGIGGGAN